MAIYKLKEISNIINGKDLHAKIPLGDILTSEQTKMIYVKTSCFANGLQKKPSFWVKDEYIENKNVPKLVLNKGDLVVSKAINVGEVSEISYNNTAIYRALSQIIPNEDIILKKYLIYYMNSNLKLFQSFAEGSIIKIISLDVLSNLKLNIPSINEQKQIIDIIEPKEELFIKYSNTIRIDTFKNCEKDLNEIIDIIEPIERIIKNIILQNEKIDQTILSLNPKGNISKCSDIANIKTGKRNANHSRTNGKYNFYTCSDRVMKCDEYSFDSESLLVAGNGNVGNVKYFNGKFDAYQRTYVITFKEFIGTAYLSFLKNQKILSNSSQGSVIKYLVLKDIQNIEVVLDQEVNKKIVDLLRIKLINEKMLSNFENLLNTTIKKMIV